RLAEALLVLGEALVELRIVPIGRRDLGLLVRGKSGVVYDRRTDLVVFADHALVVALEAREAVDHDAVRARRVRYDVDRALVDAAAGRTHQQITLQAVRQVEDDLAAVLLEGFFAAEGALRTERVGEQVLFTARGPEVVALPIRAVARVVALDQPVGL